MSSVQLVKLARAIRDERIATEDAFKAIRNYPNKGKLEDRAIRAMVRFLIDDHNRISDDEHRRRHRKALGAIIKEMEEILALTMP